jgi:5-methyltetrahydrofolate--homocysteine methyltransferase
MIIIGEKLNSSIPSALKAMNEGGELIKQLCEKQKNADYIDVNTALCDDELSRMKEIIGTVIAETEAGVAIDTPDAAVAEEAANFITGRRSIIFNSVTLTERIDEVSKLAAGLSAGVVAMPIDDDGIPDSAEGRLSVASKIIEKLVAAGVSEENIFVDVMAESLATGDGNPGITLKTIEAIAREFPNVKTVCGLSNVSFGLPARQILNQAFLAMAVSRGLSAAICDPSNEGLMNTLFAAEALTGKDEFCMNYITRMR